MKLVLASESKWRKELLEWLELEFEVMPSGFDEKLVECEEPEELVATLAAAKAREVAGRVEEAVIIGADTVIVLEVARESEIIGKPKDIDEAREILKKLRGKTHQVFTGVAVIDSVSQDMRVEVERSQVSFTSFSDKQLEEYLETGESLGKAGAYQVTGEAEVLVADVAGSITSVIGLPLVTAAEMLEEFGVSVLVPVERTILDKTGRPS